MNFGHLDPNLVLLLIIIFWVICGRFLMKLAIEIVLLWALALFVFWYAAPFLAKFFHH